jgi:hypothetical protein
VAFYSLVGQLSLALSVTAAPAALPAQELLGVNIPDPLRVEVGSTLALVPEGSVMFCHKVGRVIAQRGAAGALYDETVHSIASGTAQAF